MSDILHSQATIDASLSKWQSGDQMLVSLPADPESAYDIIRRWWFNVGNKKCAFCEIYYDRDDAWEDDDLYCGGCPFNMTGGPVEDIECHPAWLSMSEQFDLHLEHPTEAQVAHIKQVFKGGIAEMLKRLAEVQREYDAALEREGSCRQNN